jgi:hypothetical protein
MMNVNKRERFEQRAKQVKEEVLDKISRLSPEEIFEMICAPEATDNLEDINFDEETERDFIEGWLREEIAYSARIRMAEEPEEMEGRHV